MARAAILALGFGTAVMLALAIASGVPTAHSQTANQGGSTTDDVDRGIAAHTAGDYALALKLFQVAAGRNNAAAQYNLGLMHSNGQGVKVNYAEAVRWYSRAADQDHPAAMGQLGTLYVQGLGVAADPVVGMQWLQRAASKEYAPAKCVFAWALVGGYHGVKANTEQGLGILRQGASQRIDDCEARLGMIYVDGVAGQSRPSEGVALLRRAAEKGLLYAAAKLGNAAEDGVGMAKDAREAVAWYRKAMPESRLSLASLLIKGPDGVRDVQEGVAVLEQAIAEGNGNAALNLAIFHERGSGMPQNFQMALAYYQQAAGLGSVEAMHNMAIMYDSGRAAPQSIVASAAFNPTVAQEQVEAFKWFRLAASHGMPQSMQAVGTRYRDGRGVAKDPAEAYRWLRLCARAVGPAFGARQQLEEVIADLRRTIGQALARQIDVEVENWRPARR